MAPSINPAIHPPNYTPPIGGEVSTDFKSSNRIEISQLVQILLNFYWFWGPPSRGWGWVEWVCGGWRWCGDNGDNADDMRMTVMMWGQCGDNMGTTRMWRPFGDNVGTMGMWRPCGDNKITKNAITFEWIEIIQFCLKIWDPWTLLQTYRVDLICRWGVSLWNRIWNENKVQNLTKISIFTQNC